MVLSPPMFLSINSSVSLLISSYDISGVWGLLPWLRASRAKTYNASKFLINNKQMVKLI